MTNAGGSDDNGSGGAPRGGASPADTQQQDPWALIAQDIYTKLVGMVGLFVPNFPQQELPRVVEFMVREQQMYSQTVMRTLIDDQAVLRHPKLEIVVQPMRDNNTPSGPAFTFACPKRPTANPEDMLRWLVLMMFILCPEHRALMRIAGFNYELHESIGGPKLWTPGQKM